MAFKNILVAIDGSKESDRAVEVAVELAEKLGSKITFLHVVSLPEFAETRIVDDKIEKKIQDALVDAGKKILGRATRISQAKRVSASEKLVVGYPSTTIETEAGKLGADLIVMGSKGTAGVRRMLIGSTAEKVIRFSSIPVLVIKMGE
ncbi:MAG: universal stress protein [Promethearchaeati archaeon SRVP18_Atabeyarchaeia-1]